MAKPQDPQPKAMTARERFRAKTVGNGATNRRWKAIKVVFGPDDVEDAVIRSPSLSSQEIAHEAGGMEFQPTKDGKAITVFRRPLRLQVEMILATCYEPRFGPNGEILGPGDQPMFTRADEEVLFDNDASGWVKSLADQIGEFLNAAPGVAAKNSEATSEGSGASA